MQRLTTLLALTALAFGLLAGAAVADNHYPIAVTPAPTGQGQPGGPAQPGLGGPAEPGPPAIRVAPILVERPELPAAVPPDTVSPDIALAPGIAAAPALPGAQAQLATTGSDVTVGAALALALLLSGAGALWAARRRRLTAA